MLNGVKTELTANECERIVTAADGYSCSDLKGLVKEAAMGPVREKKPEELLHLSGEALRAVTLNDFAEAFKNVTPSVTAKTVETYHQWEKDNKAGAV